MAGEQEAPALPGEVWRFDDASGAVTVSGDPAVPRAWHWVDGCWVESSKLVGLVIMGAWAMTERARAEKAEARLRQWGVAANGMSPRGLWARSQGGPWQCSGCGYVERAHRCANACPSCKRVGYMCGSVDREALLAHDEAGFAKALADCGVEP